MKKMGIPLNIIVAVCSNDGIGYKGNLPWNLKNELRHFSKMTKEVKSPGKKNAVIMGRKTWDSLPKGWQPLPGRFNFVLSTQSLSLEGAVHCTSLDDAIKKINSPEYEGQIETAWVIGGSSVYDLVLKKKLCDRVYLTRIMKEFDCDTFLHWDFSQGFKEITDERVPKEVQEENQIRFVFHVFEKDKI